MGTTTQKNFRFEVKDAELLETLSSVCGMTEKQIIDDGLRFYLGTPDKSLDARREFVIRAIDRLKQQGFSCELISAAEGIFADQKVEEHVSPPPPKSEPKQKAGGTTSPKAARRPGASWHPKLKP